MGGTLPMSFAAAEFADNPEPRCPCVLLVDTSTSTRGRANREANAGLALYRRELAADPMASKRVETALVTFGPVRAVTGFRQPEDFDPGPLAADGDTPIGEAVLTGIALLERRKAEYKRNGVAYFRPWVFLITDGSPTDDWAEAAEAVRLGEAEKAFSFFGVGVGAADMGTLRELCVRTPLHLEGMRFRELFLWLSASLAGVSASNPGDRVAIPSVAGWAEV